MRILLASALLFFTLAQASRHSEGHHGLRHTARHSHCARCPPEWGVVKLCTPHKETLCHPCPPGTWTPAHPHLMHCRPCSKCGKGLYIHKFCHPTADTQCGVCTNPLHDRFTADYLRKCAPRPVPGAQDDPTNKLWEERTKNEHPEDKLPPVSDPRHRLWQLKDLRESAEGALTPEVVLKPSFHEYQLDPNEKQGQQRKGWLLLGLSSMVMLTAALLSGALCARRLGRRQRLYVQLTDQDHRIIQECARNLDEKERQRQAATKRFGVPQEEEEVGGFRTTENPLAELLPALDDLPHEEPVRYARTHSLSPRRA